MFSLLEDSIDDLIEALQHTDADSIVVKLLLAIFRMFGNVRLSRFIVEYELSKEENEDLLLHRKRRLQSRDLKIYTREQRRLLAKIQITDGEGDESSDLDLPDVTFLEPLKNFLDEQQSVILEGRTEILKLDGWALRDVGIALMSLVGKTKSKGYKLRDPYTTREEVVTAIEFSEPSEVKPSVQNVPDDKPIEPEKPQSSSSPTEDDQKRAASDDLPQRASKRVRTQDDSTMSFEDARATCMRFVESFNSLTSIFGVSLPRYDLDNSDRATTEFLNCLNNWSSKHTDAFLQSAQRASADATVPDLLNANNPYQDMDGQADTDNLTDVGRALVRKINMSNLTFPEARVMFLFAVLGGSDGARAHVVESKLDRDLYNVVENFVIASEADLADYIADSYDGFAFMTGIFEVLVNSWIQSKQQTKKTSGRQPQDNQSTLDTIESMVKKWNKILGATLPISSEFSIRHEWAMLMYMQASEKYNPDVIRTQFKHIGSLLVDLSSDLSIHFPNYDYIADISLKSIRNECDKLEVLVSFEKVLHDEQSDVEGTINLLEGMLFIDDDRDTESLSNMEKFVRESPVGLKLTLWKTLLDLYVSTSRPSRYIRAMDYVLPFLYHVVSDAELVEKNEALRQRIILIAFGFYGQFIEGLSKLVKESGWDVTESSDRLFEYLVKFLSVLYTYCVYERMGQTTRPSSSKPPTPSKSVAKMRDMIADTFVVFLVLFKKKSDPSSDGFLDLLSVVHEEIGLLHFCDASSGRFLELSQHMLKSADVEKFEVDILQQLHCHYHISISTEHFVPFDHTTHEVPLDTDAINQFSGYLFGALSKRKDPLTSQLKPDLKAAIDAFYDTIGDPSDNNNVIIRNTGILNNYLAQSIDMKLFRDAFWGSLDLSFKRPNLAGTSVAEKGLYYFHAASSMNLYKSRKRLALGKSSDLENIIKVLTADVISGTSRLETWVLLGEAYALQAEDDLVWTSDRLNSADKKFAVAIIQRKSMLCYCMALSWYVRESSDPVIGSILFTAMAKDLYHSLLRPMEGFCYFDALEHNVLTKEGLSKIKSNLTKEKYTFVMKLVVRFLRLSINCDKLVWLNYFYMAKALHKLKESPAKVINAAVTACKLSDGALEPHYQLCAFLYKYVRAGTYPEAKANSKLERIPLFSDASPSDDVPEKFASIILGCLRKITSIDKKKWQHRPKYKIAKILYEFGEYKKAIEEMNSFVILKSNNKALLHIWKPESEVPGKHFYYTYDYACFYLDLLWKTADFPNMVMFVKKLRRFGSSMVDINGAWEKALFALCYLSREIMQTPRDYTETEIPKLVFPEFTAKSQRITDTLKNGPLNPDEIPTLVLIFELFDVRRINNGFGPTALIDDTLNAAYLKFYLHKVEQLEASDPTFAHTHMINDGPNPAKLKVARKDVIVSVTSLVRSLDDSVSKHKISEDVGFTVPSHVTSPERRGSIIGDANSTDGVAYSLRKKPIPADEEVTVEEVTVEAIDSNQTDNVPLSPVEPSTPQRGAIDINDTDENEFYTPEAT